MTASLNSAAVQWANEKAKYNGEKIGEGDVEAWGHYTQVLNPHSSTSNTRGSRRQKKGKAERVTYVLSD